MRVPFYQVDAFASRRFAGNPAAVMILDEFGDDRLLQAIAAENNLAETAFLVPDGRDYRLRWFTPAAEVPLCGHATLASAAVVMERREPGRSGVVFQSKSGPLTVERREDTYVMNFPARPFRPVPQPEGLTEALGMTPLEVAHDGFNIIARLETASQVRDLSPDIGRISALPYDGVIVTAQEQGAYDFVSRYFAPAKGIAEDPVTGSAHCALAPFWAERLGKSSFRAFQASRRGGEMGCRLLGERVELEGRCVFFLSGEAEI